MTEGTICIELEDKVVDWMEQKSTLQHIRQSKLLTLWEIKNFQSLGKKFFGEACQPPIRKCVIAGNRSSLYR